MPITIDNWYIATSRPLILGGANSEMYNGASTDAIPTPIPPMSLATISKVNDGGKVDPNAEMKNKKAATISTGLRPYLSLIAPAISAPAIAPTSAELANQPTSILSSPKYPSTILKVPDITAVSNPNNTPPNEATKQTSAKKNMLPFSGIVFDRFIASIFPFYLF